MRERKSNLDFKDHVFTTKVEGDTITYTLKKPNTWIHSLVFVNTAGILAVTGDYGNWIFSREFHPSFGGYVSEMYWIEKLNNSSSQVPGKYDSDATAQEIREKIKEIVDTPEDSDDIELLEYYENLLNYVHDEIEYTYMAYRELPSSCVDLESIPFVKELDYWLYVVFDAFDEMCNRMGVENKQLENVTVK